MTLPLISILIPVFNNEERIERAVRTAFSYAYFNHTYEVIVLDDGSDDDTMEMLTELKDEFLDLYILHNENRVGYLNARYQLFNASKGDYIFYLCGDCSMTRKALWKSYDALKKYESDMLLTAYIPSLIGMRYPRIGVGDLPEWYGITSGQEFIAKAARSDRGCFHGHGKLVRREPLQQMFEQYRDHYLSDSIVDIRDGEAFITMLVKANPNMKITAQDIETTVVVLPKKDDDLSQAAKNRLNAEKFSAEMKGRQLLKELLSSYEYGLFDAKARFEVKPAGDIKCAMFAEYLHYMRELFTPYGLSAIADSWIGWATEGLTRRCADDLWKFLNITSDESGRKGYLLIFDQGRIAYNPRWAIERLGADNLWLKFKANNHYDQFKKIVDLSEHDSMLDCFAYDGPFLMIGSQNLEGLRMSLFFWMARKQYYWYV